MPDYTRMAEVLRELRDFAAENKVAVYTATAPTEEQRRKWAEREPLYPLPGDLKERAADVGLFIGPVEPATIPCVKLAKSRRLYDEHVRAFNNHHLNQFMARAPYPSAVTFRMEGKKPDA